jgi:hypothetical protein
MDLEIEVNQLLQDLKSESVETFSYWHSGARAERQGMSFARQEKALEIASSEALDEAIGLNRLL